MSKLNDLLARALVERFEELAARVAEMAGALSQAQFWKKPFAFGNSFGHLVLHVTGNLNYYIGAQIAATGYVRDRPLEFTEEAQPSKEAVLKGFNETVAVVTKAIRAQSESDWERTYTAKGEEDAKNRLTIVLRCLTHVDHHVGQMQYLSFAMRN